MRYPIRRDIDGGSLVPPPKALQCRICTGGFVMLTRLRLPSLPRKRVPHPTLPRLRGRVGWGGTPGFLAALWRRGDRSAIISVLPAPPGGDPRLPHITERGSYGQF